MTQGVAYDPSAEHRRTVRAMAGFGVPQDEIATFLDIDAKTLRKHFRIELDRGGTEATAKVAQSLFRMATESNNVAAAIFWMKARAGWTERQRVEHTAPFAIISGVPRADDLTDEELQRIARRGLDEDDEPRPRGARRSLVERSTEMTEEEWLREYGADRDKPGS